MTPKQGLGEGNTVAFRFKQIGSARARLAIARMGNDPDEQRQALAARDAIERTYDVHIKRDRRTTKAEQAIRDSAQMSFSPSPKKVEEGRTEDE